MTRMRSSALPKHAQNDRVGEEAVRLREIGIERDGAAKQALRLLNCSRWSRGRSAWFQGGTSPNQAAHKWGANTKRTITHAKLGVRGATEACGFPSWALVDLRESKKNFPLSNRETGITRHAQIVALVRQGFDNREIAQRVGGRFEYVRSVRRRAAEKRQRQRSTRRCNPNSWRSCRRA